MRILVVEDDRELASILERALTEQLHHVEVVHDGETGRHLALTEDFDIILLDVMLPVVDGITVCRAVREARSLVPIIMLTARDAVRDRVLGLDAGADDYLVKPFSMEELLARVRAHVRRAERRTENLLVVGKLALDPRGMHVEYGARKIQLTAKEFALLEFFMRHPDQVVSRAEILDHVWDTNYEGLGNIVDVYVNYLRNKLESEGEGRIIETARGRGYCLTSEPSRDPREAQK